jgi:hypothetical protein
MNYIENPALSQPKTTFVDPHVGRGPMPPNNVTLFIVKWIERE